MGTAAVGAAALGAVAGATTLLPKGGIAAPASDVHKLSPSDRGSARLVSRAAPVPVPSSWDYTADVVVVGYGGAGAVSAITAAEQGSSVIVLEKAPGPGGSTSCASGHLQWASNAIGASEYVLADGLGTLTPAIALAVGTGLSNVGTWYSNHNVTFAAGEPTSSTAGDGFPGAQYYNFNAQVKSFEGYPLGTGMDYFMYLQQALQQLASPGSTTSNSSAPSGGIRVFVKTPAVHLIQNPDNGMILGVQASDNGQIINVCANKGVILSLGGYEGNREMISVFNNDNPVEIYPAGCPYSTGDGVYMTTEIGARLWHFDGFEYGYYGFKPSTLPSAFWLQPGGANSVGGAMNAYIIVNSAGTRFHPESTTWGHIKTKPEPLVVNTSGSGIAGLWPNWPYYMIFDNTILKQGPVGMTVRATGDGPFVGWNFSLLHEAYQWSKDNSVEIANGWIVQNSTLAGLAAALNINATGLQTQVTNWNSMCATSPAVDTQLGRTASTMAPINNPPYCGIVMCMTMINTQGGAEHDENNQIVDTNGNPIAHLYGAGEFGSYYGFLYAGSNLSENVVDGVIAGTNAAAQIPWS